MGSQAWYDDKFWEEIGAMNALPELAELEEKASPAAPPLSLHHPVEDCLVSHPDFIRVINVQPYHCIQQRSAMWDHIRNGLCITSSTLGQLFGVAKGKSAKQLLLEKRFVRQNPGVIPPQQMKLDKDVWAQRNMAYGEENEPVAIKLFQEMKGVVVFPTGIWLHPTLDYLGGSPDGIFVDADGTLAVVEVKCRVPPYDLFDTPQPSHLAQLCLNMLLGKLSRGYWINFQPPRNICVYSVNENNRGDAEKAFKSYIFPRVHYFAQCVKENTPGETFRCTEATRRSLYSFLNAYKIEPVFGPGTF